MTDTPYTWDGTPYPRVTNITKVWRQPELESWMRKVSVDDALERIATPETFDSERSMAIAAPFRHRDQAAARGTSIHNLVEQYLSGATPEIDDLDLAQSYMAATKFIDKYVEEVLCFERPIYNGTYLYAGTADLFARLVDGRIACIDWKSGSQIYRPVALQLAAYCNGEWTDEGGAKGEVPPADVAWAVHIRPDDPDTNKGPGYAEGYGVFEVPQPFGRPWRTFVAARTIYHYQEVHERYMGRII